MLQACIEIYLEKKTPVLELPLVVFSCLKETYPDIIRANKSNYSIRNESLSKEVKENLITFVKDKFDSTFEEILTLAETV